MRISTFVLANYKNPEAIVNAFRESGYRVVNKMGILTVYVGAEDEILDED